MIQGEEESGDEDEDWKHPGEIVGALAAFNREVDHSEAYDSVVQSQAESTLLSPSFGSRGLIDFGWKDRPRWVYFIIEVPVPRREVLSVSGTGVGSSCCSVTKHPSKRNRDNCEFLGKGNK